MPPHPGVFESTFIEIILPGRKNLIVGCIYRHPSSNYTVNNDHIEPLLQKISTENKICSLMGDLLKTSSLCDDNTETINSTNWAEILQLNRNDPNLSIENLYSQINFYLDEFAPYKRISKKEFKLKSKPWISQDIQFLMWERDKIFDKYCKENSLERRHNLYNK